MADAAAVLAGIREFDQTGVVDDSLERRSYEWCYWRKPDGTICFAPMWPTEMVNQLRTGWTLLDAYGSFSHSVNPGEDGGAWRPSSEPWRRIFMRGGAHEFSVAQVREHGWHRKPPYRWAKFPQVTINPETGNVVEGGVELVDHFCELCPPSTRRPYMTASHLQTHQMIGHPATSADSRNARNMAAANQPINDLVKALVDRQEKGEQTTADLVGALSRLVEQVVADKQAAAVASSKK